jgi:hypothetical protein
MERLEVSGAVRPLEWPLGVKGFLNHVHVTIAVFKVQDKTT